MFIHSIITSALRSIWWNPQAHWQGVGPSSLQEHIFSTWIKLSLMQLFLTSSSCQCHHRSLSRTVPNRLSTVPVITRAISVAADGMVLALTLNATWKIYRASQEAGMKSTLVSVFIRNGRISACIYMSQADLGIFRVHTIWVK